MSDKKSLVINLFGGPGSGKSTMASALFSELKYKNINCELVTEFAKDLTWEDRKNTLSDQIYVFGKQYHKIYRLLNKVDIIITDSPLLLTLIYDSEQREYLRCLAMSEFMKMDNYNVFLNRVKPYNQKGRNQTEKESILIDGNIKRLLNQYNISYDEYDGSKNSVRYIVRNIINRIDK